MATLKSRRNQIYRFNRLTGKPSKLNGMRASKNSHPNDFEPGKGGHTQPVKFTCADDTGVRDPSRRRHAHTKAMHKYRKQQERANG